MDHSIINVRYAKALFAQGKEKNQIGVLHGDMVKIAALCRDSAAFMQLLGNPVIRTSQKKEILQKVFETHISELCLRFILLVTENNREIEIPGICRNFIHMVRTDQGIVAASVTTAEKLPAEIVTLLEQNLEKETGKQIELTCKVNQSLIGGMVLRIEDQQFDGSIATQLKKIKTAILSQ